MQTSWPHPPDQAQITNSQVLRNLSLLVRISSEWLWWAALPCQRRGERFEGCRMRNRLARVATLDVRIGGGANAAGIQLTYCDTDCTGLILQCAGIVFKSVCEGAALRC